MGKKTLLTRDPTKEEIDRDAAVNLDWDRFGVLLDICYEHYISSETKPDLAGFCRLIVNIGEDFEGDELLCLPSHGRYRMIGEMITRAVTHDHERKSGTTPVSTKAAFKSTVSKLVDMAHQDGHPKNKTSQTNGTTAFEFVSDLLLKYGIINKKGRKYSASTISNWCD